MIDALGLNFGTCFFSFFALSRISWHAQVTKAHVISAHTVIKLLGTTLNVV